MCELTTNQASFQNKKGQENINCKPKIYPLNSGTFSGRTEYKGEFLQRNNTKNHKR